MHSKRQRLDRFISQQIDINKRHVRALLAQGRVTVNGTISRNIDQIIDQFSVITFDDQLLQQNSPCYLMLHKPDGVVCATKDQHHTTVIDLLTHPKRGALHIAGRLDLHSTGLVLLTNDGRWSRTIAEPKNNMTKHYLVTLKYPLNANYIDAFANGFYFDYEGITTRPAELQIVSNYKAIVRLKEGRYHQIKRMFGRFRNPVMALHRFQIGPVTLDPTLEAGQSRELTQQEISMIKNEVY